MKTKFAANVAACAVAMLILGRSTPAQATITEVIGGPGGSPFTIQCPDGTAVIGIHADAGAWLDGVALLCQGPTGDRQQVGWAGGKGGSPQEVYCAQGQFVTGISMTYTEGNGLRRQYVNTIGMNCGTVENQNVSSRCIKSQDDNADCGARLALSGPFVGSDPEWADELNCPPGEVMTGLVGRYGNYVDALGAICGPAPTTKLELLVGHRTIPSEAIGRGMENNSDRPGSDYSHFSLPANGAGTCQSTCSTQNRKCRAWTYVRPGTQGSEAVCYLKDSAPAPVASNCCISGTQADPVLSSIKETKATGGFAGAADHPDLARYVHATAIAKPASSPAVGEPGGIAGPAPTMTGMFDTDFGQLTLNASEGAYTVDNGRVHILKIYGDFMDGTWMQSKSSHKCPDGSYRGSFHFQFTKTGFTGTYGYCDGPANAGTWNGTRR